MTCLLACSPSIRLAIGAFLPCAGGCGVLVRSCLRSAPAGVGFWSVPVWGWPVGWFCLVVFSPFLLGLCGLLGGLRPFVSLVWSCWHLLRRLPFTSARSTWGPFTSQSFYTQVVTGVFCQSAIDSAQNDHAAIVQSILENKDIAARLI